MNTDPAPSAKLACALPLFLLILFFIAPAAGAEEIIWVKRNFPPAFILEGDLAGQGIHDQTVAMLQEQMPEYSHRAVRANHPRMKKMMQSEANVCRAGLYKSPRRERAMYMSIAHILVPPPRIYMKKRLREKILPILEKEGRNRISLEKLIQRYPELRLGIEAGRSYSKRIDAVLERYRDRSSISNRYVGNARGYIKMLQADRIDCLLEVPPVFLYILRESRSNMEGLCSLEIVESPTFQPASIGCSKTAAGAAIIDRINTILHRERSTEAFRRKIERWIDPDAVPAFRKAYESAFLADTPAP